MDKFPDTFTRAICYEVMEKCQLELIKSVRESFFDNIQTSVRECTQLITLEFPDKLWHEHRVTLIKELLERFGKMQVKTFGNHPLTQLIKIGTDIPLNVKFITLEFIKEN
jgi:hypothetical protein